jgi:cytochrome P450 monooxygenase
MASCAAWLIFGVFLALYFSRQKPDARLKQIPIIRYSDYLPDLLNRFIFYPKAKSMIYPSYEKVR